MSHDAFPLLLLLEILLPLVLLVVAMGLGIWHRRRADVQGMRDLIDAVQDRDEQRKEALREFLANNLGFEEPDLSQRVSLIDSQRKAFYKALVQAFIRHDARAVAALHEPLDAYADTYHLLAHQAPPSAAPIVAAEPAPTPPAEDSVALNNLRKENKRLKEEVHITLSTLNNIFSEYTSMFGETVDQGNLSVEEIIAAMEKYSGQSPREAMRETAAAEVLLAEAEARLERPASEPEAAPDEASAVQEPDASRTETADLAEDVMTGEVSAPATAELDPIEAMIAEVQDQASTLSTTVSGGESPLPEEAAAMTPPFESEAPDVMLEHAASDEEELSSLMRGDSAPEQEASENRTNPDIFGNLSANPLEPDQDELDMLFRKAREDAEKNG